MSFILEALKKSEIERQRQAAPGLMDTPRVVRRNRLPPWALALCALLGINLIVLGWLLTRGGARRNAAPAPTPLMTLAPVEPGPATEHFSPLGSAPVFAPEIPEIPPAPVPRKAPAGVAQVAAAPAGRRADPVLIEEDAKADDQEVLPAISEINLTGADALPQLHLDVHVYATKSTDRFVYINMRKYREGATTQEGPVVERIRRDGVVLSFHGVRFILPRRS